jgi:hypothetical protein
LSLSFPPPPPLLWFAALNIALYFCMKLLVHWSLEDEEQESVKMSGEDTVGIFANGAAEVRPDNSSIMSNEIKENCVGASI